VVPAVGTYRTWVPVYLRKDIIRKRRKQYFLRGGKPWMLIIWIRIETNARPTQCFFIGISRLLGAIVKCQLLCSE
jgi:hypothetical protein